jgi:hypothetical protein
LQPVELADGSTNSNHLNAGDLANNLEARHTIILECWSQLELHWESASPQVLLSQGYRATAQLQDPTDLPESEMTAVHYKGGEVRRRWAQAIGVRAAFGDGHTLGDGLRTAPRAGPKVSTTWAGSGDPRPARRPAPRPAPSAVNSLCANPRNLRLNL